ncbi:MAG: hypothetical protein ACOYOT_07745 [Bacteroidales bacterium]
MQIFRNRKITYYTAGLIFLMVTYTSFFEYVPTILMFQRLQIALTPVLLFFVLNNLRKKGNNFIFPIKIILISFLLSLVSSYYFWGQSILDNIKAVAPSLSFLIFFYLIKSKLRPSLVESILLLFGFLYVLLFLVQTFVGGSVALFGYWNELTEVRGVIRIVFPGEGFLFFALFYFLNKTGNVFKLKDIIILGIFVATMIMQATRIYIFAFILIALFHLLKKSKLIYRIIAIASCIGLYYMYSYSTNPIIVGIRESNQEDSKLKDDYIRVQAADYFLFHLQPNPIASLLGNGAPFATSEYGKKIESLKDNEMYFIDDLGIIGGYTLFGILFVVGYIYLFYLSIKIPLPYEKMYLKYYIWAMIIMSLTTRALHNGGFVVTTAIVLYLYQVESKKIQIKNLLVKIMDK